MPRPAIRHILENLKGKLIGCEVGVAQGTHALDIVSTLYCHLYLVDIWEPYEETISTGEKSQLSISEFKPYMVANRLSGYSYTIIQGESVEVAKTFKDKFFDFVYIDANHTYKNVKEDILAWLPKVKDGGILGGHDYNWGGVRRAVDELLPNASKEEGDWWI